MTIENDSINRPKHYNNLGAKCECGRNIECIDVTRHCSFNIGNAIKYLWRYKDKGGIEDLKKAAWYIQDSINKNELEKDSEDKLQPITSGYAQSAWNSIDKLCSCISRIGYITYPCDECKNILLKQFTGKLKFSTD